MGAGKGKTRRSQTVTLEARSEESSTSETDGRGTIRWYDDEHELHRDGGRALESYKDAELWYQHGELHRVGGPAVVFKNGDKSWYENGERHRIDGPAMEHADGFRSWWLEGLKHREDGPAVEYVNGKRAWYLQGEHLSEDEHAQRLRQEAEEVVRQRTLERMKVEAPERTAF